MSFTNAPVTRLLIASLICISILASLLDVKHGFYILVDQHIWRHGQLWRILVFQLCYANATEVLFASMTLYSLRPVERLWGSRKFASFVLTSYALTSILIPLFQILVIAPLSGNRLTYIPSGPTPLIFAILAQYHAMVPRLYEYRVVFSPSDYDPSGTTASTFSSSSRGHSSSASGPGAGKPLGTSPSSSSTTATTATTTTTTSKPSSQQPTTPIPTPTPSSSSSSSSQLALTFSDKTIKYLPPLHLFLSSIPSSPLLALAGWTAGYLHRTDGLFLPYRLTRWRVPRWVVGESSSSNKHRHQQFEGLQRRLEGEGTGAASASASASGSGAGVGVGVGRGRNDAAGASSSGGGAAGSRRRNMGQQILDGFRGAL